MLIHFPALGPKSHCPIYDLSNSGIMLLVLLTSIHPCHRISWLNRNYLECKHKTKTIRHMKHMCVCIFYIDSDAITVMIQSHYLKWFLDWFLSFLLIIICKSALHTSQSLYLFKLGNPMQGVAYGKTAAEQTTHFFKLFSWIYFSILLPLKSISLPQNHTSMTKTMYVHSAWWIFSWLLGTVTNSLIKLQFICLLEDAKLIIWSWKHWWSSMLFSPGWDS